MSLDLFLDMVENGTCPDGELRISRMDGNGGRYGSRVNDEYLSSLLETLKKPNNVRKIFLECNLTDSGIQEIAQFLEDNTQIESLDIWNERVSSQNQNNNIGDFVPVIKKNKTLKHLVLTGIGINNSDTAPFFNALKNNESLEYLSLYGNSFKSLDVAQQIADCIAHNTALKTLNLNGHWFGLCCKEGLGLIAGSISSNTTLEELDCSGTNVDNEGAILFANELAKNINLKVLKLFSSDIKGPGAVALANSLLSNNHLIKLNLGCNSIATEGSVALAKTLETNNTLQELEIGVYSANNEGVTAFAKMLDQNTSLIKFDYNDFYTSGDGMDKLKIKMGLARNTIAFLEAHPEQNDGEKRLQQARKELASCQSDYDNKIRPANFGDFVEWRTKGAGRGGCCAGFGSHSFWSAGAPSDSKSNEQSSENTIGKP